MLCTHPWKSWIPYGWNIWSKSQLITFSVPELLFLSVLRLIIQVTCHREIWLKYSRSESLKLTKPSSISLRLTTTTHSACGFATNGCRIMPGLCCSQRLLLFACFMQITTENKSRFSFSFFLSLPPLFVSFLIRVLSHLSPSANAHHPWVCGVQPIQPSGLQQLQAGREPRREQQGNGRTGAN